MCVLNSLPNFYRSYLRFDLNTMQRKKCYISKGLQNMIDTTDGKYVFATFSRLITTMYYTISHQYLSKHSLKFVGIIPFRMTLYILAATSAFFFYRCSIFYTDLLLADKKCSLTLTKEFSIILNS